jgi:hypothetical protein
MLAERKVRGRETNRVYHYEFGRHLDLRIHAAYHDI